MKILIYGAGVIGSIYAARLFDAKNDVVLLARGNRLATLGRQGVVLRNAQTGIQSTTYVPLIQTLEPNDFYDLIIVSVRLDQLESILPALKLNSRSPVILFMLNNPDSIEHLINELRPRHVLMGFPGVGGTYRNNAIDYTLIKEQKTTIGEMDGKTSTSLSAIKAVFENSGFEVLIDANMRAWLKIHSIFVACISASICKENGQSIQLGKNRRSVKVMISSIKEGFRACRSLGIPITPTNLRIIFMVMPRWFSILYWQRTLRGTLGTLTMEPHANAAKAEMQLLARKVLDIVHSSLVATPTLDNLLLTYIKS